MKSLIRKTCAVWGILGVVAILAFALCRVLAPAISINYLDLTGVQQFIMIPYLMAMMGIKGYLAFQRTFAPRIAARAKYLVSTDRIMPLVLAPLFCFGFFMTYRKRMIVSYGILLFVVMVVLIMRHVPQPWRGMVDLGVVAGLSWGITSVVVYGIIAAVSPSFDRSPEVTL